MKEMTLLKNRMVECNNPVGTKKTSNWKLPPIGFVYGKKEKEDPEGVSIITRSWMTHKPSQPIEPPQDFVKINKMSIRMNATSHSTHKDYRQNVNIKRAVKVGTKDRRIVLPPEDFTYGRKNRTPTPIKEVINYDYANKAEDVIKMEYGHFMSERSRIEHLQPKMTKHMTNRIENRRKKQNLEEKPLYKLKMFNDVDSKVKANLNNFKTYTAKKDNIDNLIEKVENELKDLNENEQ